MNNPAVTLVHHILSERLNSYGMPPEDLLADPASLRVGFIQTVEVQLQHPCGLAPDVECAVCCTIDTVNRETLGEALDWLVAEIFGRPVADACKIFTTEPRSES